MIHLGSEQKESADLKTQVLGAVLLLNWTVIWCHVEYVGGSGNVCPELEHLKLEFIEVHIDPVCPAVYRLKVQLEGRAVKIFSQTMN